MLHVNATAHDYDSALVGILWAYERVRRSRARGAYAGRAAQREYTEVAVRAVRAV
ncbi:hypothetical protein C9F11_27650 [Streptomyces sp. YIM 121038]|uniref:hypothetical protein n=1 Tax=Streptomyces sp. YIM 121038 TaxID=2136401 RepID=UPI0011622960|nr:hypothetical protein [Streptomyces sp. YIM 121038]QCX79130.1 hypothetical protein C9F11_27650 [Streptomyces sp. YIM 121038]